MTGLVGSELLHLADKANNSSKVMADGESLPSLEGYPIPENNDNLPLISPIQTQDKDSGELVSPIIESDKNAGVLTGAEIDIGHWSDNVYTAEKSYEANKGAVGNMGEFLGQPGFGSEAKENSSKTSKQYQGQSIYVADKKIGELIKRGDQFYLDGDHKNHIEVFDKRGNFKGVVNLDGTRNGDKTDAGQGRKLPK